MIRRWLPSRFCQTALLCMLSTASAGLASAADPVLLKGHGEAVYDAAFLPDGQSAVTASFDRTLKIWDLATQKAIRTMEGHTGIVLSVAITSDGNLVASGASDNTIRLWDVPKNAPLATLPVHDAAATAVAITPDGKTFATADAAGSVKIWDADSGNLKSQAKLASGIAFLDWRKDAQQLAAGSANGVIWLLNPADGAIQATFGAHPGELTGLAFNPSNQLFSSGGDGIVRRWPAAANPTVAVTHAEKVNAFAINPNGGQLVTVCEDKTVRLSNRGDGQQVRVLDGHGGPVTCVAYSRNQVHVATGGADKIARLFDANSGQLVKAFPAMSGAITAIDVSPDQQKVLVADDAGNLKLFQISDAAELKNYAGHAGAIRAIVFWSNGTQIISAGVDKTVRVWNTDNTQVVRKLDLDAPATALALANNDSVLAIGTQDGVIRLVNPNDGAETGRFLGHKGEITGLDIANNLQFVASSSADGTARVWELATKLPRQFYVSHTGPVTRVRFHPDNNHVITSSADKTLRIEPISVQLAKVADEKRVNALAVSSNSAFYATASEDGAIKMWSAGDGSPQRAFPGFQGPALSVTFSPNAQQIAGGGKDKTIRTWNLGNGQGHFRYQTTAEVLRLAYSPDNAKLIAGLADKTLPVFDPTPLNPQPAEPPSRDAAQTLNGHAEVISALAWSPDSKTLRTVSADKTLKAWSVAAASSVFIFQGHQAPVYSVAFSPDGKTLVSGSNDKTIRLWDIEKKAVLKQLPGLPAAVNGVTYSPDGKFFAAAVADNSVRLFDAASGNELRKFNGPTHPVYSVCFSRDSQWLAGAGMGIGAERPVFVWQKDNPQPASVMPGHKDDIYRVQFNNAGNRLLTIGYSGSLKVWDHGAKKPVFETSLGVVSYSATLSPDGTRILTSANDRLARILEVPNDAR